MSNAD